MCRHRYLIGLGSNIRHPRFGAPESVLRAALARLDEEEEVTVVAVAPMIRSAPLGPSRRRYANTAAVVESTVTPEGLLDLLQGVEHAFGRRRRGQRWGARVLDLDVLLWDGGCWASDRLTLPHREWRCRGFVLAPARRIARNWRDPHSGLTVAHLHARHLRSRAISHRSPA